MGPSRNILQELEEAKEDAELKTVEGCPVSIIREVMNDGTQKLIGRVGMFRYHNGELVLSDGNWTVDWAGKAKREEENEKRKVGDPEIIWSFGGWYTLSSVICNLMFSLSRLARTKPPQSRNYD